MIIYPQNASCCLVKKYINYIEGVEAQYIWSIGPRRYELTFSAKQQVDYCDHIGVYGLSKCQMLFSTKHHLEYCDHIGVYGPLKCQLLFSTKQQLVYCDHKGVYVI